MKFLLGVIATLVVAAVAGAVVILSGVIGVSTHSQPAVVDRVLAFASMRSIRHHAKEVKNPRANDPAALKEGLAHYRGMCTPCHGGPGAEPAEFAAGLHPAPPDLASPRVQSFSDGMLYDTIAGGIGSTGMPAFASGHSPDQIWAIVAFVRHLRALSPEEKKALGEKAAPASPAAPSAPAPGPSTGAVHAVHHVRIANAKYEPATIEASVGDTVEWENTDFIAHTATAEDRSFDSGRIDANETKRVTLKKQGTFRYYCRYHNGMRGTLIVR